MSTESIEDGLWKEHQKTWKVRRICEEVMNSHAVENSFSTVGEFAEHILTILN